MFTASRPTSIILALLALAVAATIAATAPPSAAAAAQDGIRKYVLQDIDQRVGYELVYFDLNQDRRFEAKRIIPGSSLDRLNRDNNRLLVDMTTQQTLNDFRRWASR